MSTAQRNTRFQALLEPIHAEARGYARRLCRSDAEGDDLFQEAVLRSLTHLEELRDDAKFRFWFFRILTTVHHARARRSFWKRLVTLGMGNESGPEPVGEDGSAWEDERFRAARARRALALLPPAQREAVVLLEVEGFSLDEIAGLQGATVTAVKTRVSRAREALRRFYRKHGLADAASPLVLQQGSDR